MSPSRPRPYGADAGARHRRRVSGGRGVPALGSPVPATCVGGCRSLGSPRGVRCGRRAVLVRYAGAGAWLLGVGHLGGRRSPGSPARHPVPGGAAWSRCRYAGAGAGFPMSPAPAGAARPGVPGRSATVRLPVHRSGSPAAGTATPAGGHPPGVRHRMPVASGAPPRPRGRQRIDGPGTAGPDPPPHQKHARTSVPPSSPCPHLRSRDPPRPFARSPPPDRPVPSPAPRSPDPRRPFARTPPTHDRPSPRPHRPRPYATYRSARTAPAPARTAGARPGVGRAPPS